MCQQSKSSACDVCRKHKVKCSLVSQGKVVDKINVDEVVEMILTNPGIAKSENTGPAYAAMAAIEARIAQIEQDCKANQQDLVLARDAFLRVQQFIGKVVRLYINATQISLYGDFRNNPLSKVTHGRTYNFYYEDSDTHCENVKGLFVC